MKRTYTIILTNCDCCSDVIARTSTRWMYGPRCPGCHKPLGPISWRTDGTVRATGDLEACRIYLARRRSNTTEQARAGSASPGSAGSTGVSE